MTAFLFSAALAASALAKGASDFDAQVTVKPGAAAGPSVQVPAPHPDKAVVDEVISTLDLGRSDGGEAPSAVRVAGGSKRLARPFPSAPFLTLSPASIGADYDGWRFEVLDGQGVVWRVDGVGRLRHRLEWDGTGTAGDTAARVGRRYWFRFYGKAPGAPIRLESEPVTLKSMELKEFLGSVDLEVASDVLFERGRAAFSLESPAYLSVMAERMRRSNTQATDAYKLVLYSRKPHGALARARAALLKRHFSKELLVAPDKVQVEAFTAGRRGRAVVCVLPPEKGAAFDTH